MRFKKLTRAQKIFLSKKRLNPDNWLLVKDSQDVMIIGHRATGRTREVIKEQ